MAAQNKLANELSPYLLQHAANPVNWYPWGDEAFNQAKKQDKLIFLSIGYSTCHWCHVMEQESFMDNEIAAILNQSYISIKVDREERPDIDNTYMTLCQMLTGSGGWPLTIIMTPDKKPFFAGTYFPKNTRLRIIGLMELLPKINQVWKTDRKKLLNAGSDNISSLKTATIYTSGEKIDKYIIQKTYSKLSELYDPIHGGFGDAPKFPTPHYLSFLLRYWSSTGSVDALTIVQSTLKAMRTGGIYDQIGFGFHRYSTDNNWLVPHFEKMLYDQAMLSMVYTEAYLATGNAEYKKTAEEIYSFIQSDMTSPQGGFYTAIDADSDGSEGKFYLWSEDEIKKALPASDAALAIKLFNISSVGNYQESGVKTGKNILYQTKFISDNDFIRITKELKAARDKRIKPFKDDKILTDGSGLMIASYAIAGSAFNNKQYIEQAEKAADFILTKMRSKDGRLLHRYRNGQALISANIDDYAFFIWGLIELYEATFKIEYLKSAISLNNDLIKHFWDTKNGGFYFTPDDGETEIRDKKIYDGAIPSGNSVAALNLLRLGRITANSKLEEMVEKIGMVFSKDVMQAPAQHSFLVSVFDFMLGTTYEVVIVGDPAKDDTKEMLAAIKSHFIPNKVIIFKDNNNQDITEIAKYTKGQTTKNGHASAYVCVNYACHEPTQDKSKMLDLLKPQRKSHK
ncbi:MAG: thioredoxin domain-containing protein [Nitrospirae bacterium]|nr:thioredoxin domain-containing protein [Nitrospirota bacterium]